MSRRSGDDTRYPKAWGEDSLIEWLRRQPATEPIGDDAAVLTAPGDIVVTTDTQIAGVHVPIDLDPAHIARRLLAVNMSDVAAMGATPTESFLVLAAPPGFDHRRFLRAFTLAADRCGVVLAGGDLTSSPHLVTALTLLGRLEKGNRRLMRSGARPGHRLWIGGPVGSSRLGLEVLRRGGRPIGRGIALPKDLENPRRLARAARTALRCHLLPEAQVALGQWLASSTTEGGAIDLSDGLARDLGRMCRSSDVGAEIDRRAMRPSAALAELAQRLDVDIERAALEGGEDYVLCFTLPSDVAPPARFDCRPIGRIVEKPELLLLETNGSSRRIPERGWDHVVFDDSEP